MQSTSSSQSWLSLSLTAWVVAIQYSSFVLWTISSNPTATTNCGLLLELAESPEVTPSLAFKLIRHWCAVHIHMILEASILLLPLAAHTYTHTHTEPPNRQNYKPWVQWIPKRKLKLSSSPTNSNSMCVCGILNRYISTLYRGIK